MWGLRLERKDGVVWRGLRPPELIRVLAIFSAISWLDNEGRTVLKVFNSFWVDIFLWEK